MSDLTQQMREKLREPFPVEEHAFKPAALTRDKTRGLGLAYVDPRRYADRLDQVDPAWRDEYKVIATNDRVMVLCRLTVGGLTRQNGGECTLSDENAFTSAVAQAFKRACAKFGLGRYLYSMPRIWAAYDQSGRSFSDAGYRRLRGELAKAIRAYGSGTSVSGGNGHGGGGGNGHPGGNGTGDGDSDIDVPAVSEETTRRARAVEVDFGKYEGRTLGEILEEDRNYVTGYLAKKADDPKVRVASRYLAQLKPGNGTGGNGHGPTSLDDALAVTMPFGTKRHPEYKGKPLGEIEGADPGLIDWLVEKARSNDLRKAAELVVASRT